MGSALAPPAVVRFGVFEADLRAGEIRRSGVKVRIQDLPFRALTLLLSRPGEVITREEFRQALWPPDVFVDFEQGISSAIMRLRDCLRDSADNPIFIETVERRGYRWIGPIQRVGAQPDALAEIEGESQAAKVQDAEEKSLPGEASPALLGVAPKASAWRKMWIAMPVLVLALLFVAWVDHGFREVRASTKLAPSPAHRLHQPANREAEEFYLKGVFLWNKRTPESLNQALEAFQQAIAHDPDYSQAYVGLADCYNLLREFSAMPGNEAFFKAFGAAKKAVELDPESSEAHASLGFVTFFGMWDAADAEKEFQRAIALDPNNAKAHHWYATFLHTLGRHEAALAEIDVARKLRPDSSPILADRGALLWSAGQREPAMQLLRQLETADPSFLSPHRYLEFAYYDTGDYPNYIAELKQDARLTHDAAQTLVGEAAAQGFAQGGASGMLESELSEELRLYRQGKLSPFFVAQTEAGLNHKTEALRYLTICFQTHDELMLNLAVAHFENLREEPGFRQLIGKTGLPLGE